MSTECKPFRIVYEFNFPGGARKNFSMDFDPVTHALIAKTNYKTIPSWTSLEFRKCNLCPLDSEVVSFCPVAFNISGVMTSFGPHVSTEKCFVRCLTFQRSYSRTSDVMSGLASILSLIVFSSPCPYLENLRSLARFHLPFFTPEESLVRIISFYLLSQYFVHKKSGKPDWDLKKLNESFVWLKMIQEGMMARTKGRFEGDACVNALHSFHVMIQFISFEIESSLECIETFFGASDFDSESIIPFDAFQSALKKKV